MKFSRKDSQRQGFRHKRKLNLESLERRRLLAANCEALAPMDSAQVAEPLRVTSAAEAESSFGENLTRRISADVVADVIGPYFAPFHFGADLVQEVGNKLFVVDPSQLDATSKLHIFERNAVGELEEIESVDLDFRVTSMMAQEDQVILIGNQFGYDIFWPADANRDGLVSRIDGLIQEHEGVPWDINNDGVNTPIDGLILRDFSRDLSIPYPIHSQTIAVTVNLGDEVEVIRQELDGSANQIHQLEDQVLIVSQVPQDIVPAIYPPPPIPTFATVYDITNDGLRESASASVASAVNSHVHNGDLYITTYTHPNEHYLFPPISIDEPNEIVLPVEPDPPLTEITRYSLGEEIVKLDSLALDHGYTTDFRVSDDGLTAISVRTLISGAGPATAVDLISLADNKIELFETVRLQDVHANLIGFNSDVAVLQDYGNSLLTVQLNQSIDVAAENRVGEIDVSQFTIHHNAVQYSADRIAVTADDIPPGALPILPPDTVMLTISMSEGVVLAESDPLGGYPQGYAPIEVIDRDSQRVGFTATVINDNGESTRQFTYGHLRENEFVAEGSLNSSRWLEIDTDAERLIARQSHQLIEYRWETPDAPVETPLGENEFEIEAVDDEFVLNDNGEDHFLDVLFNDNIIHAGGVPGFTEIVELVGAPAGTEIVGHSILLRAEAIADVDSLRFEYVISNGESTSTAVVEVSIRRITDEQVEELVGKIREQAAIDFGVGIDEVQIGTVERIFDGPLPIVQPDGTELDLSPGILVIVTTTDSTALYAASIEGEIIQVFSSGREIVAELGLRATDQDGVVVDEVAVGDTFWLEFTAQDLRQFGLGVYAAFFDLVVPEDQLVINGPIEYGPGFTSIPDGRFGPGEIDDLGAISNEIDSPGSELQVVLRIAVEATAPGTVTLTPEAADERGTETLLRGESTEVPDHQVRYESMTLNIVDEPTADPLDADGNGLVTAADALVVINFLGRYGTTDLAELQQRVSEVTAEGEEMSDADLERMRRFDTNGSGFISALDALVVINKLRTDDLRADIADDDDAEGEEIVLDGVVSQLF